MIIKRKSCLSGVVRSKNIDVDPKDYEQWEKGYTSIQEVMGYLKQEDREFILAGITPDEWKRAFADEINNIVMDKV